MNNKHVYWIIWAALACACAALLFLPFKGNAPASDTEENDRLEYISCSPDQVLSGMSMDAVFETRDTDTAWTETGCSGWERFSCFCETAFKCGDYELYGRRGEMTYYFDGSGKLSFSCFRVSEEVSAAEEFERVSKELSDAFGEYSRTVFDDYVNGEHHTEEKRWYIITPDREHMDNMRSWEYISVFLDSDRDELYIFQFGWGIDPTPEGCGICQQSELYDTYLSRED